MFFVGNDVIKALSFGDQIIIHFLAMLWVLCIDPACLPAKHVHHESISKILAVLECF